MRDSYGVYRPHWIEDWRPSPQSAKDMLLDMLAVIHRDGGHHTQAVGVDLSYSQAMKLSSERIARIDELERELKELKGE